MSKEERRERIWRMRLTKIARAVFDVCFVKRDGEMADLVDDVELDDNALLADESQIDEVVVSRMAALRRTGNDSMTFRYLFHCFRRSREMREADAGEIRDASDAPALDVVEKSLLTFMAFEVGREPGVLLPLIEDRHGTLSSRSASVVPDFVAAFMQHAESQPSCRDEVAAAFPHLVDAVRRSLVSSLANAAAAPSAEFGVAPLDAEFVPATRALRTLALASSSARAFIVAHSAFFPPPAALMHMTGRQLQAVSYLGPFFTPSAACTTSYYGADTIRDQMTVHSVNSARSVLRLQSGTLHTLLHDVLFAMLRDEATRDAVLSWFSVVTGYNRYHRIAHDSRANPQDADSGFMVNVSAVLLRLCAPFAGARAAPELHDSALSNVDPSYPYSAARVYVRYPLDETKLAALSDQLRSWFPYLDERGRPTPSAAAIAGAAAPRFVSHVFWLTHASLNVGLLRVMRFYRRFVNDIQRLQRSLEDARRMLASFGHGPNAALAQMQVSSLEEKWRVAISNKLRIDAQLHDPSLSPLSFYAFTARWLLRTAECRFNSDGTLASGQDEYHDGADVEAASSSSSLSSSLLSSSSSDEVPQAYAALPEHILENLVDAVQFMFEFPDSGALLHESEALDDIITLFVVCVGHARYTKNPYLRAKIATALEIMSAGRERRPDMSAQFERHPVARQRLMPGLVQLFVDIERTDRHNEFHEKFSVRSNVSRLIKRLRATEVYAVALEAQTKRERLFSRFVNMMCNDSSYLLDEMLKQLVTVRTIEDDMGDRGAWIQQPEARRQERREELQQQIGFLGATCAFANNSVELLEFLTRHVPAPFAMPEIANQLAVMLNFFLERLSGAKALDIRVRNPQRFNFSPRKLLASIVGIYLNLAHFDVVLDAIALDERSFSIELFERAAGIIERQRLLDAPRATEFRCLIDRLSAAATRRDDANAREEEAPDEFFDPLMFTIMNDPVTLPTSNMTVDRAVITRHLLTDETDPFNRQPLTIDQLQPNDALRQRIEEWKLQHQ
jgi:ubiquitin conjugation factor E4 B